MTIRAPIKSSSNREVRSVKNGALAGLPGHVIDKDSRIPCLNSESSFFAREYFPGNISRLGPCQIVGRFPDKEFFTFVKGGGPGPRMSDSSYLIVDVKA